MKFNQTEYIKEYQKKNYKMYQFRVKKENKKLIKFLDTINNRNEYIINLLENKLKPKKSIYTIKQIKDIIMPILSKYSINEVYLFGSYARGDADENSDIDIFCEAGTIKSYISLGKLEDELMDKLNKKVDVIFNNALLDIEFEKEMKKDLIKLC